MKKFLSITMALVMLLSCFVLSVAAEDAPLTTAPTDAPETEWQQFEQTIMSKVEPSGEAFVFVQEGEPIYVGLDTAGNEVKSGAITPTLKADWILTDENGESYFAGDGTWRGRSSDMGYFIYQYRIAAGATKMQWTATVGGQYGIYIWLGGDCPEADETKWVKLAAYEGEGTGKACEPLTIEADLTQLEGYESATYLYIKITDDNFAAGVKDGYGGRIALGLNYPVTLSYDAAPWILSVKTVMSEVVPNGDKFAFVQDNEPLYVGLDTAGNEVKSGAINQDLKPEWILTDADGKTYFEGDGTWRGRSSDMSYFIYQYQMVQDATKMQWTATVGGQYGIYLWIGGDCPEADETKWVKLAVYEGEGTGKACTALALEADLTQFEGYAEATHLYIKVTDDNFAAGVKDGYGGRIALGSNYPITLSYDVDAPFVGYDSDAAAKAAAQEEAQVVIDQINELTAYSLEDLNDENYQSIFSKIRQARRAYDALSEFAIEIANEAGVLPTLEAAEALKAEYEAILEAKENEPTEDPADPVDPTDPADPTEPEDPADPADPTEPEDPADKGGINPIVIVVIAVVVIAAVVVIIIIAKKKK